jgi:hypothetical protein
MISKRSSGSLRLCSYAVLLFLSHGIQAADVVTGLMARNVLALENPSQNVVRVLSPSVCLLSDHP